MQEPHKPEKESLYITLYLNAKTAGERKDNESLKKKNLSFLERQIHQNYLSLVTIMFKYQENIG
jgi:hypothetical protein